jgi:hypothetical protein
MQRTMLPWSELHQATRGRGRGAQQGGAMNAWVADIPHAASKGRRSRSPRHDPGDRRDHTDQRQVRATAGRRAGHAAGRAARPARADRYEEGLRPGRMRRLHRAGRRQARAVLSRCRVRLLGRSGDCQQHGRRGPREQQCRQRHARIHDGPRRCQQRRYRCAAGIRIGRRIRACDPAGGTGADGAAAAHDMKEE